MFTYFAKINEVDMLGISLYPHHTPSNHPERFLRWSPAERIRLLSLKPGDISLRNPPFFLSAKDCFNSFQRLGATDPTQIFLGG